jgi:hypothetical protein
VVNGKAFTKVTSTIAVGEVLKFAMPDPGTP